MHRTLRCSPTTLLSTDLRTIPDKGRKGPAIKSHQLRPKQLAEVEYYAGAVSPQIPCLPTDGYLPGRPIVRVEDVCETHTHTHTPTTRNL